MKIILLRHEKRGNDIGFHSHLTDEGFINTYLLKEYLYKLNIDYIFSSPFIRTLETIYPYCNKYNKKVNLEYSLYEYIHNPYFLLIKWYNTINDINSLDDQYLKSIINNKYISISNKEDICILENEENLERRIIKFFNYLNKNYKNKTILIVSHKGVLNKIKDIYFKKTEMDDEFEMGKFEIYYTPA